MATSSHWTIRHLFVPAPYAMSDLGVIVLQTLMRRPTNDDSVGPRLASAGAAHDGPAAAQVGFGSSAPNLIDIVRVMSGCPSTPDIPLRRGERQKRAMPDLLQSRCQFVRRTVGGVHEPSVTEGFGQ